MSKDILSVTQTSVGTLPKGQKLIADFILESYDKAAFMTVSCLGRTVDVNESTMVRFVTELGCGGYPVMQKALQEIIRSKLTSIQRIKISNDHIGNQDILSMVMQLDMSKIHMALEETNREDFDRMVSAIMDARHIYTLGVRSVTTLASLLGFHFNLIFDNATVVHATSTSEVLGQFLHVGSNDVVVGVSFPWYSRRTVKAMQFAHDRGTATIALINSKTSPLTPISTLTPLAKSDMTSFVDSLVAPLSLINALIVVIGRKKSDDLSQILGTLEQIWDEYEVYEKVEEIT